MGDPPLVGAGHETRADLLPDTAVGLPGAPGLLGGTRGRRPRSRCRGQPDHDHESEHATPHRLPPLPDEPPVGYHSAPDPPAVHPQRADSAAAAVSAESPARNSPSLGQPKPRRKWESSTSNQCPGPT